MSAALRVRKAADEQGVRAPAPAGTKMLDKYEINVVYFSKGQDKRRSVKLRPLSFPAGQGHTNDFTVH